MQSNKSNSTPFTPSLKQQQILTEVRSLFHETDGAELIYHLNEILVAGVVNLGDVKSASTVIWSVARINTFLVRLMEIRHYGYEEMLDGGRKLEDIYSDLL